MKKLGIGLMAAVLPALAAAQTAPLNQGGIPPSLPDTSVNSYGGLIGFLSTVGNWAFGILLALAVLFIIYAAYLYLFSQGGDNTSKAKSVIIYAIVAIVVAIIAKGLVTIAQTLVH